MIAQGIAALRRQLPLILEDAENGLTPALRELLSVLYEERVHLDERIARFDQLIETAALADERCQRLLRIPGIGLLTASALSSAVGDASQFTSGREMAAWLGRVPRQHTTGGQPRLLSISQRGDHYRRWLLIQGARAARRFAARQSDRRRRWVVNLEARRGRHVATVALANKHARLAWALLTQGTTDQAAEAA